MELSIQFTNDLYFITPEEYTILLGLTNEAWMSDFVYDSNYQLYFISGDKIDDEGPTLIDRDMVHPWVYTSSGQPAVNYPGHTRP